MKRCCHCKQVLPIDAFSRSNHSRDGLQSWCKTCQAEGRRSRKAEQRAALLAQLPPVTTKRCPRCEQGKEFAAFSKHRGQGYQTYCKPCAEEVRREYKARNAEALALRAAERAQRAETTGSKACTKCGETKPLLEFYVHRGTRDGRAYYCMECQKAQTRAWNERNRQRIKERNAAVRAADPAKARRDHRQFWLRLYGLNEEQYAELLREQDGVCAICHQPEQYIDSRTGDPRRLAVDHDHITKRVRGLLCGRCNRGLGQFADDPNRLQRAATYLLSAVTEA